METLTCQNWKRTIFLHSYGKRENNQKFYRVKLEREAFFSYLLILREDCKFYHVKLVKDLVSSIFSKDKLKIHKRDLVIGSTYLSDDFIW